MAEGCRNVFLEGIKGQLLPIIGLVALRFVITFGGWLLRVFFKRNTSELQVRQSHQVVFKMRAPDC